MASAARDELRGVHHYNFLTDKHAIPRPLSDPVSVIYGKSDLWGQPPCGSKHSSLGVPVGVVYLGID